MQNETVVHKTKAEIQKEVEVDYDQFMQEKKFNENSPLQYTNMVIMEALAEGTEYPGKAYIGTAVTLFQTDYPKYRETMEAAGWVYES